MRRVAGLAEELGFDSVWLCDHFLTLAPDAYVQDAGIAGPDRRPRNGERRSVPRLPGLTTPSAPPRDTQPVSLGTEVRCHSFPSPPLLAQCVNADDRVSDVGDCAR